MATPPQPRSASIVAHNVRRLMAKLGLSHRDLAETVGLDDRTLRAVLRGVKQTRANTLNKLASGLGVSVDSLFQPPLGLSPEAFDLATNPVVEQVAASRPELFRDWSGAEFTELAACFGVGGALTEGGVAKAAEAMNERRRLLEKARVVLASRHAGLLSELIEVLYDRVVINE